MSINLKILVTAILLLGNITKIKGDLYSAAYDDDAGHHNQELKHTIHTLKGRYNEQARRFTNCGSSIENKEENLQLTSERPETRAKKPTSEKPKASEKIATSETSTINDNFTTTNKIATENNGIRFSTDLDELEKVENKTSLLNDTMMAEIDDTDLELGILSELLKDLEGNPSPSQHVNNEYDLNINNTSETSTHPVLDHKKGSVIDSTEKQFEFESVIIKNEADKEITKNIPNYLDQNRGGADDINENITRRFMPYDGNQGQYPINYYNPFVSPPPRSYAAPEIEEDNNLQHANPITENEIEEKPLVTDGVTNKNSSEYKERNKTHKHNESDEDLLFNDPNISVEDINNRASHPTKGFGISDMVKSNLMLIDHPRVCFACSTTNNPSCWSPNMGTPAKYCRQDHDACVTKTYKHRGYAFLVRDCGNACRNKGLGELGLRYSSCTICHSDMCNSAYSVITSIKTIVFMLLVSVWFKFQHN